MGKKTVGMWKGLPALVKKGEVICDNELVNFFRDGKHKNCSCSESNFYGELIKHFFYYNRLYFVLIISLYFCPNKK